MKILENQGGVDQRVLSSAIDALRNGDIIIYPTDTVYALGCDALNNRAVERLCRIKGLNPDKNFLSIVCEDFSQAANYARIDNFAFKLLKQYLPGPLTFILPAATTLPKVFKGRKTVGVRIPDCEIARALAAELGNPILTTSVPVDDTDEMSSATSLAYIFEKHSEVVLAIDGGEGGTIPCTIVDCTDSRDPIVIRHGAAEFEG